MIHIFVLFILKNVHWCLIIVMPQIKSMLYFDSLYKFAEPKKLFSLITSFMNFYCLTHRIRQISWYCLFYDEVYQQKTDKYYGMFCCLNAYYFLNGYPRHQDKDSIAVRYWMAYQCNRFHFEFQRMKEKIVFDENEFFEILSISRDIQIKNLPSLILPKGRRPSLYENVFKDIKALFFTKNIAETVPSRSQGIDSGNEETDNEFDGNEKWLSSRLFLRFTGILSLTMLKN